MYAVYAFCREVDDIADDADTPPEQKAAALDAWRSEIEALYAGRLPRSLVGRALRHPILYYSLRREDFRAVIDGMEMDAVEDIRAPDMAMLDLYCARVAAAVGHLSVHVFGDPSPDAHAVADSLGRALQLTNILRDLDEDARRGRLYLPREILERHGIRTAEPLQVLRHPALPAACRDLAAIATRHFDEAGTGNGALLAARDAAGGDDGGLLSRDARCAGPLGMARPEPARGPVEATEALAGAAPRDSMTARPRRGGQGACRRGRPCRARGCRHARRRRPPRSCSTKSGAHAGGRCRSFHDAELGVRIDNGNHLLLSGNRAALSYVERIGALDTFERPDEAAIPFVDLADGARWEVRPSRGAVPWWILRASRRVPGTRTRDYLAALRLRRAAPGDTVAELLDRDTMLFRRLWEPLVVAALNTSAEQASAVLFSRILAETIGRGAAACRPMLPREGLSESLVDPALEYLTRHGGEIRFGSRLKALGLRGGPRRRAAIRRRQRRGAAARRGRACRAGGDRGADRARPRGARRLRADRQRPFPL